MKRLFAPICCLALAASVSCSSSPDRPDSRATDAPSEKSSVEPVTSPLAAAEAWLESDDAKAHQTLLGDSPMIERLWVEGENYRALAGSAAIGKGEGDGVLLTLKAGGEGWEVTDATVTPAAILWPGI